LGAKDNSEEERDGATEEASKVDAIPQDVLDTYYYS